MNIESKIIRSTLTIALVILFLIGAFFLFIRNSTDNSPPPKPSDTDLAFWIAQDVSQIDFSHYEEITGWFGARQYYGHGYHSTIDSDGMTCDPEHFVKYLITAYPDYADGGQYITKIEISDPTITLYGLSVNSSLDAFDETFKNMDYEISSPSEAMQTKIHVASKNGIHFILNHSSSPFILTINADVSNKYGIAF